MPSRKGLFIYYTDAEQFHLLSNEQLGLLIRSLISYSQSGVRADLNDPAVAMAFSFMASRDDRDSAKYSEICEKRKEAGKKGGRPPKANGFSENQKVFEETKGEQKNLSLTSTPAPALTSAPDEESVGADASMPSQPLKREHGRYGWVHLSDEEYARLLNDLGEYELDRCIKYIDESAQTTGNKNKWKDWNLVIRRCHRDGWGLGKAASKLDSRNQVKTAADYDYGESFV